MRYHLFRIILIATFVCFSSIKVDAGERARPTEALDVAQRFVDAINEGRFNEAYLLTDKDAKIAPAWFSNSENFTKRARRERPFSKEHPGKLKLQSFKYINSKTLSAEFFSQFEVRLCQRASDKWKVCYFQMHAG